MNICGSFIFVVLKWAVLLTKLPAYFVTGGRKGSSFNGDISSWNVSGVSNMGYMFDYASSFNTNIRSSDVSSVTNREDMFL